MGSRDIHHCDQCAHKTTRKGNLERHLRTVHKRDVNIDSRHRLLERGPTSAPYLNESFNFNVEQQQPPRLRSMERTETTPEKMMESILDVSKWAVQIKRNMAALSNGAGGTQSPEDKVIQEFLKENLNAFAKECMPPEFQQRWADSVNTRSDSPPGTQSGTLQQSNKLTDSHSRTTIAENKLDERQKANVGNNNDGFPLGHILSRSAERTIAADDKTDEGVDSLIAMKSPSSGGPKLDQERTTIEQVDSSSMSFDKTVPNLAGVQVEDKQGIHRNDVAQKAFETNLPKPFVDGDHNIANLFLLAQLKESDQRNAGLEMETTMCLEIMRELAIERNMWRDLCCKLCEKYDAYIELMRSRINKLEQEKRPVPHFMS